MRDLYKKVDTASYCSHEYDVPMFVEHLQIKSQTDRILGHVENSL